jgi:hypothetical protein
MVNGIQDWSARRAEILRLLLDKEYGHPPTLPVRMTSREMRVQDRPGEGKVSRVVVTISPGQDSPGRPLDLGITLHLPEVAGRRPVVVGIGTPFFPQVNARGFILARFDPFELEPDTEGFVAEGPARSAYPGGDWGSLAIWAWGASRVADYLVTRTDVDSRRLVVTGHSRLGKAALLAGALDERFAVVNPNRSGAGGMGNWRQRGAGSETLADVAAPHRFGHWFVPGFVTWAGRERELPFDQHFLAALVAPRGLLATESLADPWSNPAGAWATSRGVQPVFNLLAAPRRNAIHFRWDNHGQNQRDVEALLQFAEFVFQGKEPSLDLFPPRFPGQTGR